MILNFFLLIFKEKLLFNSFNKNFNFGKNKLYNKINFIKLKEIKDFNYS